MQAIENHSRKCNMRFGVTFYKGCNCGADEKVSNSTGLELCRKEFEKRMSSDGKWPRAVEKNSNGTYKLVSMNHYWQEFEAGWLAALGGEK